MSPGFPGFWLAASGELSALGQTPPRALEGDKAAECMPGRTTTSPVFRCGHRHSTRSAPVAGGLGRSRPALSLPAHRRSLLGAVRRSDRCLVKPSELRFRRCFGGGDALQGSTVLVALSGQVSGRSPSLGFVSPSLGWTVGRPPSTRGPEPWPSWLGPCG